MLIEDLDELYSTARATASFKIQANKHPPPEEFRHKVVGFMKHFEYNMASFPQMGAAVQFLEKARKSLVKEIAKAFASENKDVEKTRQIPCRLLLNFSLKLPDEQHHESLTFSCNFLNGPSVHGPPILATSSEVKHPLLVIQDSVKD